MRISLTTKENIPYCFGLDLGAPVILRLPVTFEHWDITTLERNIKDKAKRKIYLVDGSSILNWFNPLNHLSTSTRIRIGRGEILSSRVGDIFNYKSSWVAMSLGRKERIFLELFLIKTEKSVVIVKITGCDPLGIELILDYLLQMSSRFYVVVLDYPEYIPLRDNWTFVDIKH